MLLYYWNYCKFLLFVFYSCAYVGQYSLVYREMGFILSELELIKQYTSKIVFKLYTNRTPIKKDYIQILDKNNKFFTYAIIDENYNIILRTINTRNQYNLRDKDKKSLSRYAENVYFIFKPNIKTNLISKFSTFESWTNADEILSKLNKIVPPKNFSPSFILFDIPNTPPDMLQTQFVSTKRIHKEFPKLKNITLEIEESV